MTQTPKPRIFVSYASTDKETAEKIASQLRDLDYPVWFDANEIRGGDPLESKIQRSIANAEAMVVVLSPKTQNSKWVRLEIQTGKTHKETACPHFRFLPVMLHGFETDALALFFGEELKGFQIDPVHPVPAIAWIDAALDDSKPLPEANAASRPAFPINELIGEFEDVAIDEREGERRVTARCKLVWQPSNGAPITSPSFPFRSPLGPIELDELRWYLERYYLWPTGLFKDRAKRLEVQFPIWGKSLFAATLAREEGREALNAWLEAEGERRVSIYLNPETGNEQAALAASQLFALPWELLADEGGYLFQGADEVRVRRKLPNRKHKPVAEAALPIRILLLSPRPESDEVGYIDHRASALPVVAACERLGSLVDLTVLDPPTFPALRKALREAHRAGSPYHVVHFDGHGVYDEAHGLGALCFEDPADSDKAEQRRPELIDAQRLSAELRGYRLPLMFLEACQTGMSSKDLTGSVAARLLEGGVRSVVAMSHSVLVESARRFVEEFYGELARGARVGNAMVAGQYRLFEDPRRIEIQGAGMLELRDWFVPVLYQEADDPALFRTVPDETVQSLQAQQRSRLLGDLPTEASHGFHGRSRLLLTLERRLPKDRTAVILGRGGEGKTALATELARWLVRSRRFERAAFVSMEAVSEARAALDALGRQLVPEYSVALHADGEAARAPLMRALRERPTLVVFDNLESVLPAPGRVDRLAEAVQADLVALCSALLEAPGTCLLFTSREPLPEPFDRCALRLGALAREDAIALAGRVAAEHGTPVADGAGESELAELVDAVECHARALVLLAPEVARRGVCETLASLQPILAAHDAAHPQDRERSLLASLELSLQRLPEEILAKLPPLGVVHGGVDIIALGLITDTDMEEARQIAGALIVVGLAKEIGWSYLQLDPALPAYLARHLTPEKRALAHGRWAQAMQQLVGFLYDQLFENAQLATDLTRLELTNLTAFLDSLEGRAEPERIVGLANRMELLLSRLGLPRALARAVAIREKAAAELGEWSHAHFLNKQSQIQRAGEAGDLVSALAAADALLKRCQAAGEDAYAVAAYDLAMANAGMGRLLSKAGQSQAALAFLAEAKNRFSRLAESGNSRAQRMVSVTLAQEADCFLALGQYDAGVSAYQTSIALVEERGDSRQVAAITGNLGTVRRRQGRYEDALACYTKARHIFENLEEPTSVAGIWQQIGVVYAQSGQARAAEQAYRRSLALRSRAGDRQGEAMSLNQLGNLYDRMGRLEEAVAYYHQAADIYTELENLSGEGLARNNLAGTLIKLKRTAEARPEIIRAIKCKSQVGLASTPWNSLQILANLERVENRPEAAAEAREQARELFTEYRRQGGENHSLMAQLCAMVGLALEQGDTSRAYAKLEEVSEEGDPLSFSCLVGQLRKILAGDRDPALADDPELGYENAVELQRLLESLGD